MLAIAVRASRLGAKLIAVVAMALEPWPLLPPRQTLDCLSGTLDSQFGSGGLFGSGGPTWNTLPAACAGTLFSGRRIAGQRLSMLQIRDGKQIIS